MSQRGNAEKSVHLQLKQTATNHMAGQVRFNRADQDYPSPTSLPRKCATCGTMWKEAARVHAKCPQPSPERVGQLQHQTPPGYIGSNATKGKGRKGVQRPALSLRRLNTAKGQEGSGLPGPGPPQQRQWLKPLQGQSRTACPSGGLRR